MLPVLRSVALGTLLGVGAAAALGLWLLLVGAEKAYEALEGTGKKEAK
jgi:hypothetical protein